MESIILHKTIRSINKLLNVLGCLTVESRLASEKLFRNKTPYSYMDYDRL